MEDALISVLVEQLTPFLLDKLKKEVKLVLGAPEDVQELLDTFDKISYVLDDAEKRHIQNVLNNMEKGETKKAPESAWLEKLKDVSYQMEDVLDEWHTELMKLEVVAVSKGADAAGKGKKRDKLKAWSCFTSPRSSFQKGTLHYKIGCRILELKQRLDLLVIEKENFKFKKTKGEEERQIRLEDNRRATCSFIKPAEVCGRDLEKGKLEEMLLIENSNVEKSVRVISLVGMGGIGKTTLAQYIYNQENVVKHFEKKMWVFVSDPFDLKTIAEEIIKEVSGYIPNDTESWEALSKLLSKSIEGKIFLLVLDDVWIKDRTSWEKLKLALDFGKNGSIVVVTTRDDAVADAVGTTASDKHMIGRLSDEDCWSLFKRIAFKETEEFNYQNLKEIGRDISNTCKGVPLHAKILGSLMSTKKTTEEWEEVLQSDIWDLPLVSKGVLPALLLSYNALPSHLKRCFTYCAVFAKDTEIKKDTLIKMWMAEGCLGTTKTSKLEKIGEKYFNELVMRSFFQELELDQYGDVDSCKMHDLLHDLATFLGNNDCQVAEPKGIVLNNPKLRHLCVQISEDEMDGSLNSIWRLKSLRTLLAGSRYDAFSLQDWAPMSNLTCLRTLDLSRTLLISELPKEVEKLIHLRYLNLLGTKIKELPETITNLINLQTLDLSMCDSLGGLPNSLEKLINLRYLNLSHTKIKELPETITNLINLQTLDLSYCSSLGGLPNSFGKLVSLSHLHISNCNFTKGLPGGIGKLRDLRTLSNFIVSEEGCDLGELKDLNNLRGSLNITNIRGIGDEAKGVLNNKKYLQKLCLIFSSGSEDDDLKALELLEPHSDLKELRIYSYSGSKFPRWMEFHETRLITPRPLMIGDYSNLKPLGRFSGCDDASEVPGDDDNEDKVQNDMEELLLIDNDDDEADYEKHFDASAMREPTEKDANFDEKKPLYISPTTQLASSPTSIPPRAEGHFDALACRESTKKEVIQALKDNNTKLVGVHGMGGIGKTTLVEQVCKEFEDTKLFDKVVLASVSENPDLRWIQTQIAESLGIQIEAKMISARAEILSAELEKQTQNILIILEDMWVKLELEAVGIILKNNTCKVKVLISSRSLDVCLSMNTSKNIHVNLLSNEDSLKLFHQEVGDVDSEKRMMFKEIINECHGLPLAIVSLATTLRRKDIVFWEAVTQLLKKSIYEGLDVVTTSIKRSYNYLQSSETKLCFLLCALFPKDYNILIDVVLGYGMGEGLFGDGGTLLEARENLNLMLGRLLSFNLLLKDNEEGYVKMHNVVRNTALWIARGERNESIIRTNLEKIKWPNVNARRSLRISLMNNDINELPDTPDCSQLKTLSLASNQLLKEIPNCFFKDMNRLGALDLSETGISLFPQSLSYLKNCLRSLHLDGCKFLGNISAIGDLKKLEILSVQRTEILELPEEIKGLINLKMLNLTGSRHLAAIPPNVISNLYSLEELYMCTSFHNWGIEGSGSNATLDEVASLFQLNSLHLDIENPEWISTELSMCDWENLRTFCINLPFEDKDEEEEEYDDRSQVYERYLSLRILANSYPLADWVKGLLRNTAELILRRCEDIKSVLQLNPNSFQNLKSLTIKGSKTMEYVMHLEEQVTETMLPQLEVLKLFNLEKLKAIWNGPLLEKSFEILKVLKIEGCGSLVNILPYSQWTRLQNLEQIKIINCPCLVELGSKEHKENEELTDEYLGQEVEEGHNITIRLPRLHILDLQVLPRLSSLFSDQRNLLQVILECPNLGTLQIRECPDLKRLPFGLQSTLRLQEFIIGNDEWFQRLECENPSVKSQLQLVMTNINEATEEDAMDTK